LNAELATLRERRLQLAQDAQVVTNVLRRGNAEANKVAEATLREARAAMNMDYGLD